MLDSEWENIDNMLSLKPKLKKSIDEKLDRREGNGKIYSEVLPKLLKIKNVELRTDALNFFNEYLKKNVAPQYSPFKTGGKKRRTKKRRTKKRRTKKRRTKKRKTKKRKTKKRRKSRRKR